MATAARTTLGLMALGAALAAAGPVAAAGRTDDGIGNLIGRSAEAGQRSKRAVAEQAAPLEPDVEPRDPAAAAAPPAPPPDPRAGDPVHEQSRRLMQAVDQILTSIAEQRSEVKNLPGKDEFFVPPIWTETKEDRESKVGNLLEAALAIVTDAPVVDIQKRIEGHRKNIRDLEDRIVGLREKQLVAPEEGMLPGVWTDTVASIGRDIESAKKSIGENRQGIEAAKVEIYEALRKSGIDLTPDQLDLLLDSVLSGDLVRLVATFNAAKLIDAQLARLMSQSGENLNASRKYFAMHAALFALLAHAQNATIDKIDKQYLPRLDAILKDIVAAKAKTIALLRADNRPDQVRALEANRESQRLAEDAARGYKRYLSQQRDQIAKARARAAHDLRIADNTFETVEASFQLRNLMRDSSSSFEALQRLEAPTFDQIFKNEELRREFENLTRKLDQPTS